MNELDSVLAKLVDSGLLRPAAGGTRSEFSIRHALLQQTAYTSLLRSERREIHRCVGLVLQRTLPESEAAELLAHHFDEAQIAELAFRYHLMAADDDYEKYANHEAVEHYRRAFSWLDPDSLDRDELIRVHRYYGRALELIGDFASTVKVLQELIERAEARADGGMEMIALIGQARLMATMTPVHDPDQAQVLAQRALRLARQQDDLAGEVRALWVLLLRDMYHEGDLARAERYGLEALEKARQLDEDRPLALVITDLARLYMTWGRPQDALAIVDEAYELWQRDGNLVMLVDVSTLIGSVSLIAGDLNRSHSALQEALEISLEIENPWGAAVALANASMTDHMQGRSGDALDKLERSEEISERADIPAARHIAAFFRAWILPDLGAVEQGIAFCRNVLEGVTSLMPWHKSLLLANWARLELQRGEIERAAELLEQAQELRRGSDSVGWLFDPVPLAQVELAHARGKLDLTLDIARELFESLQARKSNLFLPETLCHMGSALIELGREQEALEALVQAQELAQEMGLRRDLWRIYVEQARVQQRLGQATAVEQARARALAEVRTLLERIREPDLIGCFQKRPLVADLLQRAEGEN